jgi:phage/plasmid-associated DNA primase
MVEIIGKRMGFSDETQKGASFDEERLSNVAGSIRLQAEFKGGAEIEFPNRIKLNIAGNHRPNFISGEAGGLMRRMLLMEGPSKPLAAVTKVEDDFAQKVVEAEGRAILMWAIEGAILDYADTDNLIFNTLKQPMVEATKAYTKENSIYWQWVEARMRVEPDADIDLIEAYEMFKDYVFNVTKERTRDRRTDFRAALKAMLSDKIEISNRTSGPHKNRAYIKGLGVAVPFDATGSGNVVTLDSVRKS